MRETAACLTVLQLSPSPDPHDLQMLVRLSIHHNPNRIHAYNNLTTLILPSQPFTP